MFLSANQKTHHAGHLLPAPSNLLLCIHLLSYYSINSPPPLSLHGTRPDHLSPASLTSSRKPPCLSHVLLPVPKRTSSSSTSIMWASRTVNNQHPASGGDKKHLRCSLNRTHTKTQGISLIKLSICLRVRVFAMPTHTHTSIYAFVLQHTETDVQRDVCLALGNPNSQSTDMMREGWKESQSP